MRKTARVASLLLGCALGAGCGGRADGAPRGPDLSTPAAAFSGAMRALEAGDLATLLPFLAPAGAERLRADLGAWRAALLDPGSGPPLLARVAPRRDAAAAKTVASALGGDVSSLLRLYVAASPRPAPAPVPPLTPVGGRVEMLYAASDGSRRSVTLAVGADGLWRVEALAL